MTRGRPITINQKEDPEYFKKYYHNTKEEFSCDCGALINNHSLRKHLVTKKHCRVIELLNKLKSNDN